jgi:hypothetical protein
MENKVLTPKESQKMRIEILREKSRARLATSAYAS